MKVPASLSGVKPRPSMYVPEASSAKPKMATDFTGTTRRWRSIVATGVSTTVGSERNASIAPASIAVKPSAFWKYNERTSSDP